MPDNDSMLKLLNTQSQVSITERSDALREEKPNPSFSTPFFFFQHVIMKNFKYAEKLMEYAEKFTMQ